MSRRSYSRHIPDFRFMTYFAESGRSAVHAMSPWTKTILLALMVLFVILADSIYLLLVMFAAVIMIYLMARLPLGPLIGWYTLPVMFVLTISILFIFTEPGTPIVSFDIFGRTVTITDNGVMLVVTLLVRALIVVTFSLTVFMTTRYTYIASISSKTLPKVLANIFLLSYRFNFETSDEMSDVLDAMKSRGGDMVTGVSRQTKMFAGIFGLAFVHAFERAERISKAMEARGFSGDFPIVEELPRPSYGGYAVLLSMSAFLFLIGYSRYVSDLIGWW